MNLLNYLSSIYFDSERKTVKDLYIGDFILIYNEDTGSLKEAEITKYKELSSATFIECVFTDEYGNRVKKYFYALVTYSIADVQLGNYYIIDIRSLIDLNANVAILKIISKMTISDLQYYLPQKYLV